MADSLPTGYTHLGVFSDLVAAAQQAVPRPGESTQGLFPAAAPGAETARLVRETLGFTGLPEQPQDVRVEAHWEKNNLTGEQISWSVGYGPRTQAWLLKPARARDPLPGVLALHDHGGFKYYGKEKIAEGPYAPPPSVQKHRAESYGGRAWVNALAERGFAVLVHDTFLWGSRKFPVKTMAQSVSLGLPDEQAFFETCGGMNEIDWYNFLARHHEHLVSKYCNLLGTSMAGVVAYEDRVALNYLRSRSDVQSEQIGCAGLSGGGNRAALLRATGEGLKAAVIVGLMSTYPALLDRHVATHTWMFFPFGWARYGDWPDLAACQAPLPLLVQYDTEDNLFPLQGMRDAHEKLAARYAETGKPQAYTGQFYPGPHKFDMPMQEAAFDWLEHWLLENDSIREAS